MCDDLIWPISPRVELYIRLEIIQYESWLLVCTFFSAHVDERTAERLINMKRTRIASRNIVWGILGKVVSIFLPFATRTAMIYTLGMDYVGLGSLFTSILHVLSFAELGIGGALVFSMYKPIAEGDDEKVSALLNLYRKTYRVIGVIVLLLGMAIMPFLDYLVAKDLPADVNLRVLFLIYLGNNLVGYFLYAYKFSLFTASQRVDVVSKIGMGVHLVSGLLQIVILLTLRNYYVYIIVVPLITIINNLILGVLADKMFPQYKCQGQITPLEKRDIEKKVCGMLFQKIGNIILTSADTIVISSFLGLKVLGIYNGYYLIVTSLFGFLSVVQQALIPSIGNSIVTESVEKNLRDFRKFQFLYLWIVIWWCACLLCLYQPFVSLWQGTENMLSNVSVVLLVIYFFSYKMGDVCWMYREAMGLWWESRYIVFISAMFNLATNILMVRSIGLPGVLLSTIFSIAFISLPFNSRVLFTKYFKSTKQYRYYLIRLATYFGQMCIVAGMTYAICKLMGDYGITTLFLRGIICVIVPNTLMVLLNIKNSDFKSAGQFTIGMLPTGLTPEFIKRFFV